MDGVHISALYPERWYPMVASNTTALHALNISDATGPVGLRQRSYLLLPFIMCGMSLFLLANCFISMDSMEEILGSGCSIHCRRNI
jgi:hypothetical protein